MNSDSENLLKAQELLYVWISRYDKRSLELIKESCDYLNEQYSLELSNPIWGIFWPLVFNGQVDHVGNGYYGLTEPLIINYGSHYVHINHVPHTSAFNTFITGLYVSDNQEMCDIKEIRFHALSILKRYPSIDKVVDGFPTTLQDETKLKYLNMKAKKGIAELESNGLTRYFSIPETLYLKELPSRKVNPEAFAIAYCYSRVINEESNGVYYKQNKQLKMRSFALPFMIYRVLLLESLSCKTLPSTSGGVYIFDNISVAIASELNRILCKSIRYE